MHLLYGRVFPGPMAVLSEADFDRNALGTYVVVRLLMGLAIAWLYAAARFRLRSTVKTALRIGIAVWLLSYAPLGWILQLLEVFPRPLVLAMLGWGLVEALAASLAAGLVHQVTRPDDARY